MVEAKQRPWLPSVIGIALSLVLLIVVLPYAAGYSDYRKTLLQLMLVHWFSSELTTWQYGVLVPPVVIWLIWNQSQRFALLPLRSHWSGLALILIGLTFYWVGYKASNYYFGYLAVQLFVAGSIMWGLGVAWMRALIFPWIVFGMMWPLRFLEDRLGFPMRMISQDGVMAIAQALKLPITAEGTTLLSATTNQPPGSWMTLQVEGQCSGMNTLFALMFASLIYAYHAQKSFWRRVVLFLCSIPLALLGNVIRIWVLIAGCAVFGQEFAVGNEEIEMSGYHLLAGLLVFLIAMEGLRQISKWMNRRRNGIQSRTTRISKPLQA
ncbi:MAG: exosortase/archaeosortase family protein [Verrucomicrobiaceae bacterium]|nr:exosortase/archaeosortase family protein [Verrucomicrobiaceae bacterium]